MFQENLYVFVNDMGKDLEFTLSDGVILNKDINGNQLKGIFDNSYVDRNLGNMIIPTESPMLTCVSADIITVKKNNAVLINSDNYNISNIRPPSDGMSILELEKL
ncbi:MAG: hypothetical protein WCY19_05025 [Candidatus Gastranaerophilaceae bacterium]